MHGDVQFDLKLWGKVKFDIIIGSSNRVSYLWSIHLHWLENGKRKDVPGELKRLVMFDLTLTFEQRSNFRSLFDLTYKLVSIHFKCLAVLEQIYRHSYKLLKVI